MNADDPERAELLEAANRVVDSLGEWPISDRLFVLEVAWLVLATWARQEALAFPDGFPAEQARQVDQLEKMAGSVRADTPDLELERLTREGDFDGAAAHLRKLMDDDSKGGA